MLTEAEKHGRHTDDLMFAYCTRILTGTHMKRVLESAPKDEIATMKTKYLVGSTEECISRLGEYVDMGVDLILLRLHQTAQAPFTKETHDQQIESIYYEIISEL
jgi:hypothetical protein